MYKRQVSQAINGEEIMKAILGDLYIGGCGTAGPGVPGYDCLLYTSDAADDLLCVDLGGRRIIKKKTL